MRNLNITWVFVLTCMLNIRAILGQSKDKINSIIADSQAAKTEFIAEDVLIKSDF